MAGFNHRWHRIIGNPAPEGPFESSWQKKPDGTPAIYFNHDCSGRGCHGKQIVAEIIYNYVTGRGGRVSDRRQRVCQDCLDKWLKNHPDAKQSESWRWDSEKKRLVVV